MQHFHMIYDYIVTTYKLSEHKNKRENEEKAFLYLCYKNNGEKKPGRVVAATAAQMKTMKRKPSYI